MGTTPSSPRKARIAAIGVILLGLLTVPVAPATARSVAPAGVVAASSRAAATAVSYAKTVAAGRAAANEALTDTGASSISLSFTDRGRVVWRETFGAVDTQGTKPTVDTVYGIGSVSKMLATVAVMQLVEAGKVSLDAPVTRYISDFTMADPGYRQITVRMLLNHTAGLPGTDYSNGMSTTPFPGYADQVLQTLRTSRLKTTPGGMAVYCNDCFTLAGIVVARVSGQSYTDYVQDRILDPLGMTRTGFVTAVPIPQTYAPALAPDGSGPLPQEITNIYASGGAYSTPTDMSRLATMFMSNGVVDGTRILSAASVAAMGTDQTRTTLDPTTVPWLRYGLGWDTVTEAGMADVGVRAWQKGGDTTDYHAGFLVAPQADLAVTVLGAGTFSSGSAETVCQKIMLNALVAQKRLKAVPAPLGATTLPTRKPTAQQISAISGTYLGQGLTMQVSVDATGKLTARQLQDGEWVPRPVTYTLRSDGRYWSTGVPANSLRVETGWARTYLVASLVSGAGYYRTDVAAGQKVRPGSALSTAWQQRVGKAWLLTNDIPSSINWRTPGGVLTDIPDLPGYLEFSFGSATVDAGFSDTRAVLFLVLPMAPGRDQNDIDVVMREGQEWLHMGHGMLRPLDGVPALGAGASPIVIGPEGYAEWRSVPAATTLAVSGASDWALYDSGFTRLRSGSGAVDGIQAPEGSWLLVFGAAGATVTTTLG